MHAVSYIFTFTQYLTKKYVIDCIKYQNFMYSRKEILDSVRQQLQIG